MFEALGCCVHGPGPTMSFAGIWIYIYIIGVSPPWTLVSGMKSTGPCTALPALPGLCTVRGSPKFLEMPKSVTLIAEPSKDNVVASLLRPRFFLHMILRLFCVTTTWQEHCHCLPPISLDYVFSSLSIPQLQHWLQKGSSRMLALTAPREFTRMLPKFYQAESGRVTSAMWYSRLHLQGKVLDHLHMLLSIDSKPRGFT